MKYVFYRQLGRLFEAVGINIGELLRASSLPEDLLSRRTLQRKLTDEHTTFQQQLNSTRLLLAQNYLRDSERTNDDIAFLLGYEDTTSFLRAFSTWTGQTVTEYKKR